MFNLPAHRLLKALLTHSPSPKTIAKEFLRELGKCGNPLVETLGVLLHRFDFRSELILLDDWAAIVLQGLQENAGDISTVTQLASHYLTHLVIAFRNPGGPKTPQDTVHPTPNHRRIEEVGELLRYIEVMLRDGDYCLLTGLCFFPPTFVPARCAHIIPFSIRSKTRTFSAIETFSGFALDAEAIQNHLNHPRNVLNLESNAHDMMDKHMGWGIEAISSDDQDRLSATTRLKDGDEIHFGAGIGSHQIALPDPRICNIHLAVCRVSYACGASEVFDQFLDDEDDEGYQVPVYFGGPFVSDNILMRKLETLLL
ncbi:hypothetical protein EDD17DRAFT_1881031 [Pisolithus thermaeus]|nr:hypothetical protein EV401DRAFT_2072665 [Pisolithus croceorrhizus]KAI6140922.1 hypothetical protein EDD17DRAFT_1881031 [Pisolithus thermaeus]